MNLCFICGASGFCAHREPDLALPAESVKGELFRTLEPGFLRFTQNEKRIDRAIKRLGAVEKHPVKRAYLTGSPEEISHRPRIVHRNPQGVRKL